MSPLFKGKSNAVVSANVKELKNSGKSEAESVAIALSKAGRGKGKTAAKKTAKAKPLALQMK